MFNKFKVCINKILIAKTFYSVQDYVNDKDVWIILMNPQMHKNYELIIRIKQK